jgi:hypothetical protein
VSRADAHVAALSAWTTAVNSLGTWVNDTAADVAADSASAAADAATANNAAASATASASSAINAPGTNATSTTSLSISIASKVFTIQTGKAFVPGMFMIAYNSASNWMFGQVTAYDSGTGSLTLNVTKISGSGTYASWQLSLTSPNQTQGSALCLRVNSNTNVLTGITYLVDTSAGSITLTLPSMSASGYPSVTTEQQMIGFVDLKGTFSANNLIVAPASGQQIMLQTANETMICNMSNDSFLLGWTGLDWRFF